ncbi:putative leucine-rich repeat receptor-like serine/threonine-protein kinase [Cucumis melo var. makuwa]|uniref:Leucine-rich repeat receptor-like serine/threonine-protein kinase n=1 Tax=Cucumis melo var. makuwa TaxID=1194695 RepID=A0A5A7VGV7_CUCMM|nr:putative leucine-rich repeat receptor-like serine/threonine-protein kinase [Cucumis melo var. makuwa]
MDDLRRETVDDTNRGESSFSSRVFRIGSRKKLSTNRVQNVVVFAFYSTILLGGVRQER